MTLLQAFIIVYLVLAGVSLLAYIPKLVGFLDCFKDPKHQQAEQKRMIGLVIPARNESTSIGDLFASIKKQDYDRSHFKVNVIVKDEDDPTIEMAKKMGANVLVVPEQTCKGDVLDAFFKSLSPKELQSYDAFVIVDADCVLAPDYVTELNNALENEHDVFLTRKFYKNALGDRTKRSLFSNNSALTWPMLDDLGNRYRNLHGIPLTLCGQGMMIRRSVVERLGGWPYRTMTEDYELRLDGLLKGFRSLYWPFAVLYTEEALSHKDNYGRRLRWLTGYAQCDIKYKKHIKAQIKANKRMTRGEYECLYGVAPLISFAVASVIAILAGIVLAIVYGVGHNFALMWGSILLLIVLPVAVLYVFLLFYAWLAYRAAREAYASWSFGEKLSTLLFSPVYTLEYIPIYVHGFVRLFMKARLVWIAPKRERYEGLSSPDENTDQ